MLSKLFIKNEESPTPNPIVPLLCSFFLLDRKCKIWKENDRELPFDGEVCIELVTKIEGFIDNIGEVHLMV